MRISINTIIIQLSMQPIQFLFSRTISCLIMGLLLIVSGQAQEIRETDEVRITLLRIDKPEQAAQCYTKRFDKQTVKITFAFEDTINSLADFVYEEDPLPGPDCFVPDIKLVFRHSTYVVSLYCTKVLRYRNSAPFTPSSRRIKNDLAITEGVQTFLRKLKEKHFPGERVNSSLIEGVKIGAPLKEGEDEKAALDLLLEEELTPEDESDLEAGSKPVLPEESNPDDPVKSTTKPPKKKN